MLSKKINVLKNNKVSECFSLADFFMPTEKFLDEISQLSCGEKLIKIYEFISRKSLSSDKKSSILKLKNIYEIICLDDELYIVDLSQNDNLSYKTLIVENSTIYLKICSYLSLYYLIFIDLYSDYLDTCEKVNFILPFYDKTACISALIFKKFNKSINLIIAGDNLPNLIDKNSFYKPPYKDNEFKIFTQEFFEDYGYAFDAYSSSEIFAYESYIEEFSDNNNAIFFSFLSPYLTGKETFMQITGKIIKDEKLAVKKLYEETAIDVPENLNKVEKIYYDIDDSLTLQDFLHLLDELL
ncbi:MAG: hypothetical protein IJW26_03700 [Clostridia bacterium]|nr:hypothetical protein [Clostridia bacterium]